MTFLGKVLELRSQKVFRRRMDAGIADVISRCLRAAVEGPFFSDAEMENLFEQDRASLSVLAGMWERMNLASPHLRRSIESILEMLLERGKRDPAGWERWIGMPREAVEAALEAFREMTSRRS
ncbi:MAG: hypothetical protein ACE5GJ_01730 [Gemmatimonadota bacterium]